jgi:hypothetical protein
VELVFVSVTICGVLATPTSCAPNARGKGAEVVSVYVGTTILPVRAIVREVASLATFTVSFAVWVALVTVGRNVTSKVQSLRLQQRQMSRCWSPP